MDVGAVLDHLAELFGTEQERFAVVGGHALLAHGVQRLTFDLDILVRQSDQSRLIASLEDVGFETLHWSSGYSNHAHTESAWGRLDVVYVDDASGEKIFEECTSREVAGRPVPVPSTRVLTAMKLHAIHNDPSRRLQDLADIRALLEQAPQERRAARDVFVERGREAWLEEVGLGSPENGSEDE